MKIISIKQSRLPNRIFVTFDDKSFLPFSIDDVVKLSLSKNMDIDSTQYATLVNSSLNYLLYSYALNQIALSSKNEYVLNQKLNTKLYFYIKKYSLDKSLIDTDLLPSLISKVKSQNLIDDTQFVLNYIQSHPGKSRREIEFKLRSLGVDTLQIKSSWFSEDSEKEKIKKLITKKVRSSTDLTEFKTKNKLMAFLIRKGFPLSLVKLTIDEYLSSQ